MGPIEHWISQRSDVANSLAIPETAFCYICLEDRGDGDEPLVRACACRGENSFCHLECIAHFAETKENELMGKSGILDPWMTCNTCRQEYVGQFNTDLARVHYKKYKDLDPKQCSENFYKLRGALDHIVSALLDCHKPEEALGFCERLHNLLLGQVTDYGDGRSRIDWIEPIDIANSCNLLGGCYIKMGQLDDAMSVFLKGLDYCTYIVEGVGFSPERVGTEAVLLNNVAEVHAKRGEFKEAVRLRKKMLRMREKACGKDSFDYIQGLFSLACVLVDVGKRDEGIEMMKESRERAQKVLGPLHHHVMKYDHFLQSYESNENVLLRELFSGRLTPNMAMVHGLKSRHDLNGAMVEVSRYNEDQGRYKATVRKDNGQTETIAVKPCNLILQKGVKVIIRGLKSAKDLNGKKGDVIAFHSDISRYSVLLSDGSKKEVGVKPENAIAY